MSESENTLVCSCKMPMWRITDLTHCAKCKKFLPDWVPTQKIFGYSISELKRIIDFAKSWGYDDGM